MAARQKDSSIRRTLKLIKEMRKENCETTWKRDVGDEKGKGLQENTTTQSGVRGPVESARPKKLR